MKILITQNHLADYAGSEMITLETASALSGSHDVTVYTNLFGAPIQRDFTKQNIPVITDDDTEVRLKDYDIIWVHHQLLPPSILQDLQKKEPKRPHFIFNHMSPYEPYEFPFLAELEPKIASLILVNSPETQKMALDHGLSENKIMMLDNPAPDEFYVKKPHARTLKSIAVITNHCPPELSEAIQLLREKGHAVDTIGRSFNNFKLVTPSLIKRYDLIVGIGKNVQLGLVAGIPVYVYDHFGGPGYLTLQNFSKARKHNFSGRGFDITRSAQEIADDITANHAKGSKSLLALHEKHATDFLLSSKLDGILRLLKASRPSRATLSTAESKGHTATLKLIRREFLNNKHLYSDLQNVLEATDDLRKQLYALGDKHNQLVNALATEQQKSSDLNHKLHIAKIELEQFPTRHVVRIRKTVAQQVKRNKSPSA